MKQFKILICVLLICLSFTGCSENHKGLSEVTIVQGIGIDEADNKETKITLQFLNLSKSGGSTESLVDNITTTESGEGDSIASAVSDASKSLSKSLFFGQNKIIVLGMDYVKDNLDLGMDYLIRSIDSRADVLVALSDSKAEDIIKSKERNARVPAESIYDLLNLGEQTGLGSVVSVNQLLNMYSDQNTDVFMPVLKPEKESVKCTGIAFFSQSEYVATLDENQSFGFLLINNKIKGGSFFVKNEKLGNVGLEIIKSNTKKNVEIKQGKIILNIDIYTQIMLDEVQKGVTTAIQEKEIQTIEALVNQKMQKICYSALDSCLKNRSDPFMISRYVARCDEKVYNRIKDNWRDYLSDVVVNINVDSVLERVNDNSFRQ